jgi:hypothetical protein
MMILNEVISPQVEKCRGTVPKQVEHDGAAATITLRAAVHQVARSTARGRDRLSLKIECTSVHRLMEP